MAIGTSSASSTIEIAAAAVTRRLRRTSAALAGVGWRGQSYADAAYRGQVARLGRRLAELAAQPREVHVDGLVRAAPRLAPHLDEQVALGDHLARALGQVGEQVELARRQLDLGAVEVHPPTGQVDRQPADGEGGGSLAPGGRTPEHRTHAGVELGAGEGLHDVV